MSEIGTKMGDDELLTLIQYHEQNSIGNSANAAGVGIGTTTTPQGIGDLTTVEIDRWNALNFFYTRPFGNEQTDRSQVVIPYLRDTVEWLLPQLMRIFHGVGRVCTFDATKPGDEQMAEQESDAVNYVFEKLNDGFNLLYDAFKDALLLKNYYFKVGWERKRKVSVENYSGLTILELTKLFLDAKENDEEIEILAKEEREELMPPPDGQQAPAVAPAPQPGQPQPAQDPMAAAIAALMPQPQKVWDCKIRRVSYKGQVVVKCVPPEEMRVSVRARANMNESPFTEHVARKSRSELLQEGFDKADVMAIPAAPPSWVEMDKLARNNVLDEMADQDDIDPSIVEVEVKDCYIYVDFDGDGVAELRHIVVGGTKILENEEVAFVPFATGVPCRMSHRHVGMSLYDLMGYLQQIYSMLFRQGMDETYLATNSAVVINQRVNMDDLLTKRPGQVVRTKDKDPVEGAIMAAPQVGNAMAAVQPLMDLSDRLRTMHTGVGENTLGLDPDALQDITNVNGQAALSSAQLKIEMIAILLGEGLRDLFQIIHATMIMNQDQKMDVQLRGKWIEVDPSQWRSRTAVTLNVGLGSGNRQELRQNAQLLASAQQSAGQVGLVGPKQVYNTALKILSGLGLDNGNDQYFLDPDGAGFAQLGKQKQQAAQAAAQNAPAVLAAKIRAQVQQQADAQDAQFKQQQALLEHQLAMKQITLQQYTESARNLQEQRAEAQKMMLDHQNSSDEILLNAFVKLASSALMAKAQPQQIGADVQAAMGALN